MGLTLYLIRHGHSPSLAEAGVESDAARPLSAQGREGVRRSIAELLKRGGKPALILHSPLTRAVQSAQEAEALLKPGKGRRVFEPLSNVLPPEQLWQALEPELRSAGEVLAVGHQPQLGELAALLSRQIFDFKPGGLVAVDAAGPGFSTAPWSFNP